MAGIPTCCVTGRIAGDHFACGDCDPCILGADAVPEPVKRLLKERDEFMNKYEEAMSRLDTVEAAEVLAEFDANDGTSLEDLKRELGN